MGDAKDQGTEEASLELPSLFRRRKRTSTPEPTTGDGQRREPVVAEPTDEPVVAEPTDEPVAEPSTLPSTEPDADAGVPVAEPIADPLDDPAEPGSEPSTEPIADPLTSAPGKAGTAEAVGPEEAGEPTLVIPDAAARRPVEEPAAVPPAAGTSGSRPGRVPEQVEAIDPRVDERVEPAVPETPARPAAPLSDRLRAGVPEMPAGTAAAIVGAVVGLLGCIATWIGLQGCEVVTGAQTCGGPGLLILIAIVVAMILAGAVMLKALGVADAGNLSFLGVGIMVVLALLFLIEYLYEGWMFLAIPLVTALSFGVARWVTTKYADDTDDYRFERRDVR